MRSKLPKIARIADELAARLIVSGDETIALPAGDLRIVGISNWDVQGSYLDDHVRGLADSLIGHIARDVILPYEHRHVNIELYRNAVSSRNRSHHILRQRCGGRAPQELFDEYKIARADRRLVSAISRVQRLGGPWSSSDMFEGRSLNGIGHGASFGRLYVSPGAVELRFVTGNVGVELALPTEVDADRVRAARMIICGARFHGVPLDRITDELYAREAYLI